MPWQLSLTMGLLFFLLAPFFRKWVDIAIWPKLSDWWAERSVRSVKVRIATLERSISEEPSFPEGVTAALKKFCAGMYFLTVDIVYIIIVLLLQAAKINLPLTFPLHEDKIAWLSRYPIFNAFIVLIALIAVCLPAILFLLARQDLQKLRYREKAEKWKTETEARLSHLRAKLVEIESKA
jgi:hypothetical protein